MQVVNKSCYKKIQFVYFRNNSARELSAFAESAMAVNRVVLQHMSLNFLEEYELSPPITYKNADVDGKRVMFKDEDEEDIDDCATMFGTSPPAISVFGHNR